MVFIFVFFAAIGVDIGVGFDWWAYITFPFGLTSWFKWSWPPNGVTWTISTMMFFCETCALSWFARTRVAKLKGYF